MYVPPKFALSNDQIADALRAADMAYLVSAGAAGMVVTPLPMMYDAERHSLVGHVSRANSHWRDDVAGESVAIFGGVDGYISPSLYAKKAEDGKVVPTWNYETIAVYGQLQVHDDTDWLRSHVTALSDSHEKRRSQPWSVDDAPDDFIDAQLRGIIGVELSITRWEGKAKMSQNQPERNQRSLIDGLAASRDLTDNLMAERVATYTDR
ncbi:FMN-binding negative transcriptional regulator [Williamsia sterculiae]|uniref:Negative transcriptional regulator, PaiB family n=1 Tax=Williamsia sterculiae TaxID=1344003 RepID=A0A1N7EX84_9NOCA|nr:FMN-binding negative transcriptional regulator [Williamsia sterculiae]SIR92699.1 negative transcriptional regulator, PaiB family [Williamsia sterculiae]